MKGDLRSAENRMYVLHCNLKPSAPRGMYFRCDQPQARGVFLVSCGVLP